jgi:hypothetical protein
MVRKAKDKIRASRLVAFGWLLIAGIMFILPLAASAQFAQPLGGMQNELPFTPPQIGQQGEPFAPPIGDGPTPAPVNPGDNVAPSEPGSGQADRTHGNVFPAGIGKDRTVVRVYRKTNGGALGTPRGDRMVQTIRPDQLSMKAIQDINGILGINMQSGEQSIDVEATDQQIEQIQDVFAQYPGYQMNNNRKKINNDQPAAGYPKPGRESRFEINGPLPTVRTFSRYLVILGVVSATVFMGLAASSVVLGHPYAGARVVGAAAGLMLLLMGYTIWKVVQMNTFRANSNAYLRESRPTEAQQSDAYINPATVPGTPSGTPPGPSRFGVPLEPLGGPH